MFYFHHHQCPSFLLATSARSAGLMEVDRWLGLNEMNETDDSLKKNSNIFQSLESAVGLDLSSISQSKNEN